MPGYDSPEAEFERRVEIRLAEWQANYDAWGVSTASPLYDRIVAEHQVAEEMSRGD